MFFFSYIARNTHTRSEYIKIRQRGLQLDPVSLPSANLHQSVSLIRRFSESLGVNFVKIYSNLAFSLWCTKNCFKPSRWNYVISLGICINVVLKIKISLLL